MTDRRWPSGKSQGVNLHTTEHSPVGLWQFQKSLADAASGFTLTVDAGTARYTEIYPGTSGFAFDGSTALIYNVSEAALRLLGDMTFECLWTQTAGTALADWICHTATGETEADNQLYGFNYNPVPRIEWFQEFGAGSNQAYTGATGYMANGQICHFAVTRAAGVIQPYLNGVPWGTPSVALTAPTGGSNGRLRFGGETVTGVFASGVMASAKLIASALTADQVKAEYNYTLGGVFGEAA